MPTEELSRRVETIETQVGAIRDDLYRQTRESPSALLRVDRMEHDLDRLTGLAKWLSGLVAGLVLAELVRFIVAFKLGGAQ